jgi:hypothetical protein
MTVTELNDYTERVSKTDAILGHVAWYFVADTLVDHAELTRLLKDNGLGAFVPWRPGDTDVFRRVCTAAQTRREPTHDPEVFVSVMVRDVSHGNEEILVKRIVVERVNPSGRKLGFEEQYDLHFTKKTGHLEVRQTNPVIDPVARRVAQEIPRQYLATRGHVNGAAIRGVINRALVGSQATSVRPSGGVYFVMDAHATVLEGLKALSHHVEGMFLASTPLPDNREQREMLRESFEFSAEAEIGSIQAEITTLLKSGEDVTGAKMAALTARVNELRTKAAAYTELLETNLGRTTAGVEILGRQLATLITRATGIPAAGAAG